MKNFCRRLFKSRVCSGNRVLERAFHRKREHQREFPSHWRAVFR